MTKEHHMCTRSRICRQVRFTLAATALIVLGTFACVLASAVAAVTMGTPEDPGCVIGE
jgi:hypothetical protein